MTDTDVREALHAVADSIPVPSLDRVEFQRRVRQERRSRLAVRGGLGLVVVAASVGVAASLVPFVRSSVAPDPTPAAPATSAPGVHLETPVYYLADGELMALDPQGGTHELGLRSEEILGYTFEGVWAIGPDSEVVRFEATPDEARGWTFDRADAGVPGPVQSAQLSADGRWLAWIGLDGRLHTLDLKSGEPESERRLPPNSYLADVAQGSGAPLVSEDGDLVLHTSDGPISVPTAEGGYGWASTAASETVAVVDRDQVTRVYDVTTGDATLVQIVPGAGYLAPYGDHVVAVGDDEQAGGQAWWWSPGEEPVAFAVPGSPQDAAWADDDTALVTSRVGEGTTVYGCELTLGGVVCEPLPTRPASDVTLAH